jgi:hypothetical protein
MIDTDQTAFGVTFLKLRNVFNLRGEKADVREAMQAYFKVLRRYPLPVVEAGADAWIETGTRFPKPAEWLHAIPKLRRGGVLVMPDADAIEHRRAVALRYQDEPCGCHLCRKAGVSHRFLRYVPDTDADDRDVRMLLDGTQVTRGHWAHGEELRRWYAARDHFLSLKEKFRGQALKPMPKVRVEDPNDPTRTVEV